MYTLINLNLILAIEPTPGGKGLYLSVADARHPKLVIEAKESGDTSAEEDVQKLHREILSDTKRFIAIPASCRLE